MLKSEVRCSEDKRAQVCKREYNNNFSIYLSTDGYETHRVRLLGWQIPSFAKEARENTKREHNREELHPHARIKSYLLLTFAVYYVAAKRNLHVDILGEMVREQRNDNL